MSWPSTIVSWVFTPGAGKAVPYDEYQKILTEITAIETNLLNGFARAKGFHSTTQSLTTATVTAITFDSEDYDIGAMHNPGVNPTRFTVPAGAAGLYTIIAKVSYAANATGVRVARLRKNGSDISTQVTHAATAGATQVVMVCDDLVLAVADYIEVYGFQDSGGNLNTGDAANRFLKNELSIKRVLS